jgi:hypothetical protein
MARVVVMKLVVQGRRSFPFGLTKAHGESCTDTRTPAQVATRGQKGTLGSTKQKEILEKKARQRQNAG